MKLLTLLALAAPTHAALHHALVSSSTTPEIYTIQFNDLTHTLTHLDTHPAPAPLPHLALSYTHRTLYSTAGTTWHSWAALGPRVLIPTAAIASSCAGPAARPVAARTAPYELYGAAGDCVERVSTHPDTSLKGLGGAAARGGVVAAALGADERYVYASGADGGVYTHDRESLEEVGGIAAGGAPGVLLAHPKGRYLYVVLQAGRLAEYPLGGDGVPVLAGGRVFELPRGGEAEMALAGEMLWVSGEGYVVGFELGKGGEVRGRRVVREVGGAGVVAAGDWEDGERWVGRTNGSALEVWEWNGSELEVAVALEVEGAAGMVWVN